MECSGDLLSLTNLDPSFIEFLKVSFNGLKGAGVLGGSAIVVQIIIKALAQPFAGCFFERLTGFNKLLVVSALTMLVTPIGLMSGAGLSLGASLLHSSSLTSFMVFIHELYKHYGEQK